MIDPDDLLDSVLTAIEKQPRPTRLGKIDPAYTSGDPKVVWDGETAATTRTYKTLSDVAADDRVVAVAAGSTWVILGKIGAHGNVPVGGIIMWSGTVANIPAGYALCDGTNGTPDMRDRFVVGAGSTHTPGATGGTDTATMPAHDHGAAGSHQHTLRYDEISSGTGRFAYRPIVSGTASTTGVGAAGAHTHTSEGGSGDNRPAYFAVAYIQRVS